MARHLRKKATNISVLGLFAGNGSLEDVLAADNPNGLVIDLDRIDNPMGIALRVLVSLASSFAFINRANASIFSALTAAAMPHWARA